MNKFSPMTWGSWEIFQSPLTDSLNDLIELGSHFDSNGTKFGRRGHFFQKERRLPIGSNPNRGPNLFHRQRKFRQRWPL